MTGEAGELSCIDDRHLPPKLAALRQKLSQKAKQEKQFRF